MFTPQQIDQISFSRATFGGYDMQAVDEFLEPLTEDYVTLYKENALLKSKMKVLVSKLEEYRNNEASMKDAIVNAQKTCDKMVKEAEEKCRRMISEANQAALENTRSIDEQVAGENSRVDMAKAPLLPRSLLCRIRSVPALMSLKRLRSPICPRYRPLPHSIMSVKSAVPVSPPMLIWLQKRSPQIWKLW